MAIGNYPRSVATRDNKYDGSPGNFHPCAFSEAVQRALQIADIAGHHMGIYFCGLDISVAKQFLQNAYIDPAFQHMCGETVAQRVSANPFIDLGLFGRPLYRFL